MQTDTDGTGPRTRALASLGEMMPEEVAAIEAGIAADPDTPELTDADFARMRPAGEVVPDIVATCRSAEVANPVNEKADMTTRNIRRIGEPPGPPRSADDPIEQDRESAIARGRADLAAGRVVSQEDMLRWLRSWGTDQELPPPVGLEDE